ncbi:Flagellar motor switch protein FliM [Anatilimnocola aggregata]|uniref:Flagellar motor switch protein FliM n=1 Tax=Anatilimnocola aggregata TaxID=2528021 RepID=A0A517YLA0_9BACT|nr:flagellar motor switch protein FliM [Anatilimnocola aggregata]QDU30999.1 Flagellar motor switch protein FliM [Anatilimnocola aggregata]
MADEVLSQAEVESLLSQMEAGGGRAVAAPAMAAPAAGAAAINKAPRTREKVTPYDFKRPERVGKEQMRALQSLHEGFGRNFGAAMSALLRSIVDVKLTSVDQLTYSEFVFSLENPTYFNVLRAEPLEGNLILDINPSILYPIIDRLLGGGKEAGPVARRPLTEIELRLVSRITQLFLNELKRAWENVLALKLSVERVESNPQLVQIVPPNEVVVLISFELMLGDIRGMINLCIPYNSIERIGSKLTSNSWASYGKQTVSAASIAQISRQIDRSLVDVVVTMAETRITTEDLIGLRVGDIITTDHDIRSPLQVAVQDVTKFHASPGAFKGQKAIRIDATLPPEKKLG